MQGNSHAGLFAAHSVNVHDEDRDGRPVNTKRAYDGKEGEWFAYCDHLFVTKRMVGTRVSYTVTEDLSFGFLYYQSRRNQKQRGRPKVGQAAQAVGFDAIEYEWFMADATRVSTKPCGYSAVNQYRAAIMKIHQDQVLMGASGSTRVRIPLS